MGARSEREESLGSMLPVCRNGLWSAIVRKSSTFREVGMGLYPSMRVAVVRQLLDVVHQAVQMPLRVDFCLAAQGEAIQPFVMPQVAEHRLDGRHAASIELAA